jgi:hypothetical protein
MHSDRLARLEPDDFADVGDLGEAIIELAAELVEAIGQDPESLAVALLLVGSPALNRTRLHASMN